MHMPRVLRPHSARPRGLGSTGGRPPADGRRAGGWVSAGAQGGAAEEAERPTAAAGWMFKRTHVPSTFGFGVLLCPSRCSRGEVSRPRLSSGEPHWLLGGVGLLPLWGRSQKSLDHKSRSPATFSQGHLLRGPPSRPGQVPPAPCPPHTAVMPILVILDLLSH